MTLYFISFSHRRLPKGLSDNSSSDSDSDTERQRIQDILENMSNQRKSQDDLEIKSERPETKQESTSKLVKLSQRIFQTNPREIPTIKLPITIDSEKNRFLLKIMRQNAQSRMSTGTPLVTTPDQDLEAKKISNFSLRAEGEMRYKSASRLGRPPISPYAVNDMLHFTRNISPST